MGFLDSLDIAQRACQHLGVPMITSITENSIANNEISNAYDKVRKAELRRNIWRFAIRRSVMRAITTTSMILAPQAWSSTIPYSQGSIVKDSNGILWIANTETTEGDQPGQVPVWDTYFGPLVVDAYDSTQSYFDGDLVYETNSTGNFEVYLALSAIPSSGPVDPSSNIAWSSTTTYMEGQVVQFTDGFYYKSLFDLNKGNTPATYEMWNKNTTYAKGVTVSGNDGKLYLSLIANNLGTDPTTAAAPPANDPTNGTWVPTGKLQPWTANFSGSTAAVPWLRVDATLVAPDITYPLGSGPVEEEATRNAFMLPNGFLKLAPQDPRAGSVSFLGAPSGIMYEDWEVEGNYIVSRQSTAFVLRFVADVTVVTDMDDMFCEGLGARVALETCERITQSTAKISTIATMYKQFMTEARLVNGIETGPTEPPEDDYITCRM